MVCGEGVWCGMGWPMEHLWSVCRVAEMHILSFIAYPHSIEDGGDGWHLADRIGKGGGELCKTALLRTNGTEDEWRMTCVTPTATLINYCQGGTMSCDAPPTFTSPHFSQPLDAGQPTNLVAATCTSAAAAGIHNVCVSPRSMLLQPR